jgi:hypothetical protein
MNNERIQGLLLRILSGRRRATAYADAHDLAGLNNRPRGGRLVSNGAGRRLVIGRFAFDVHSKTGFVKLLSGRLLRFAYHVRDCDRATAHGKVCNYSGAKDKDHCQQRNRQQTFEDVARTALRKQPRSPNFYLTHANGFLHCFPPALVGHWDSDGGSCLHESRY